MDNEMKRGDIYYADLSGTIGCEQGGIRPVVIIQNDTGNTFSPTTIVAPLTSKQKNNRFCSYECAMEFLDKASMSINEMIKHGVYSAGGKLSKEIYKKYEEKSYQVSLMKIRDGFEQAFEKISLDKELILFVDGIDGRPADIDSKQYFAR